MSLRAKRRIHERRKLDCFVASTPRNDGSTPSRSRGAFRPSFARKFLYPRIQRGRRESRVRAAPAVSCAKIAHGAHTSIQVQRRTSGFPCAMALRLIRDLPGEPSSVATVTSQMTSAKLGASFGRQDHTISPYARATRVRRSSRVHRIPPRGRDDRVSPLCGTGQGNHKADLPSASRNFGKSEK